jgi:colanic acid biosynthesis protein WcaH
MLGGENSVMNENAKDELSREVEKIKRMMNDMCIDPKQGLPESLFLFATTLMPVPNIDLLITDSTGRILLTWRDDIYYNSGWHIPGGCIRIKETMETRIQKTAIKEIGTEVIVDRTPIVVREAMVDTERPWLENELERSHNISFLFHACLPVGFEISNENLCENDAGYKKWFTATPVDLLEVHKRLYGDILEEWFEKRN